MKNKEQPGYPHFRCKGRNDSFRFPQGVHVSQDRVYLPKIGAIRFRKSREIEGAIKQTTIILQGNHWYVCFSCEIEKIPPSQSSNPTTMGIDLGIEHFATVAAADTIEDVQNPRYLKKELKHLKFLSRSLSRKNKRGKNWRKAKNKLSNTHARVKNMRDDFLHKLSTTLVKSHDVLVVESLHVQELLTTATRSLSRSISDAGWRRFLQMISYKCEHAGKRMIEADRYFPSTKQCSSCGRIKEIALHERTYSCECGLTLSRDHNAALNLRAVGMPVQKACGAAL